MTNHAQAPGGEGLPVVAWEHNTKGFIVSDPVPKTWSPGEWSPIVRLSDALTHAATLRAEVERLTSELAALKAAKPDVDSIMALAVEFATLYARLHFARQAGGPCIKIGERTDAARTALRAALEAKP